MSPDPVTRSGKGPNLDMVLSGTGYEPAADKQARIKDLLDEGRRNDPSSWAVVAQGDLFYVERRWQDKIYVHPIGFEKEIEATRAAARLNARDAA